VAKTLPGVREHLKLAPDPQRKLAATTPQD
jgi:hypothetical protein